MKIAALYLLFLLCVLIDMFCSLLQFVCKAIEVTCINGSIYMDKIKRKLINRYNEYTMSIKNSKKIKSEEPPYPIHKPVGIVGVSRTSFMKELPVLCKPKEEIKPFKSESLEVITEDSNDFDNEPESFDVESYNRISEYELDNFEYADNEDMINSSGGSFEELSETISILNEKKIHLILHKRDLLMYWML